MFVFSILKLKKNYYNRYYDIIHMVAWIMRQFLFEKLFFTVFSIFTIYRHRRLKEHWIWVLIHAVYTFCMLIYLGNGHLVAVYKHLWSCEISTTTDTCITWLHLGKNRYFYYTRAFIENYKQVELLHDKRMNKANIFSAFLITIITGCMVIKNFGYTGNISEITGNIYIYIGSIKNFQ